jgi:hypothetical protein
MYPEKKLPAWMVLMIKETSNGELNSLLVSGASEAASILPVETTREGLMPNSPLSERKLVAVSSASDLEKSR